jgi:hypothetical protein
MASVKVVDSLPANAGRVWELLRDFGGIHRIADGIESCKVEGEGVGAVRTLQLAGGLSLQERLEAFDDEGRSLRYAIIGEHPLPLDDYLSTVSVVPEGDERCTIDWSGTFQPKGSEEQVTRMVEGIYRGGIKGIRKTLGV